MKRRELTPKLITMMVFSFLFSLCSCTGPVTPEILAFLKISVDQEPIQMTWRNWVQLWYMTPVLTITEINGAGANIDPGTLEFVRQNKGGYEIQEISGGRINANGSISIQLIVGTSSDTYDKVIFTISGKDDFNHKFKEAKEFDLYYVRED